jgi:hypothetical protein
MPDGAGEYDTLTTSAVPLSDGLEALVIPAKPRCSLEPAGILNYGTFQAVCLN